MKIITQKWSWAKDVQSPNIYRDEQFIESNSKEEALEAIDFLFTKPKGLTYTITVCREGKYFTYFRHSMPCYGGLVKYRASHGDRYNMNPYFPRDIYVAFPEGDIVYIACQRDNKANPKNEYNEFILSPESPWVSCFGTKESILFKDKYFVLTNMDTDPTAFYSLLRLSGFLGGVYAVANKAVKHPKAQILLSKTNHADPRRLAGQKPIRISGGTWAEGFGYTRPYNESIFKTKLPHKLAEFKKLGSYPQAPHTNEYFVKQMKEVFKFDVAKPGDNADAVLLEAWEYFKQEAAKLDE